MTSKVKKAKKSDEPEEVFSDKEYEESQEHAQLAEKKNNRSFFIGVGLVVIILIAIVLVGVYWRTYSINKDTYNNFRFNKVDGLWQTYIQRGNTLITVPFHYHPMDLESYVFEEAVHQKILIFNGTFYVTLNPDLNSTVVKAGIQVARITGERFGILNIPTFSAITNLPSDYAPLNYSRIPIVTCENATSDVMVIWLKKGIVNSIYSNGNCVIIEGKDEEELVKGAEKLDYLILGIMQ